MTSRGKYIIVEGADGTGKSTAVKILKDLLEAQGRTVRSVNILKDDSVSAKIREILTTPGNVIHPDAEACLYAAAVTNVYRHKVVPLLEQGIDVVCDRSYMSALAYQAAPEAAKGNHRPGDILHAAYEGYGGVTADAIVMLYVDETTGLARVSERDGSLDRIEQRGVGFQVEVQEAYRNYCEEVSTRQPIFQYLNNSSLEDLTAFIESVIAKI